MLAKFLYVLTNWLAGWLIDYEYVFLSLCVSIKFVFLSLYVSMDKICHLVTYKACSKTIEPKTKLSECVGLG